MSREILITTPENIAIEYELAGLGTRAAAYLIDSLLKLLVWICIGVVFLLTVWGTTLAGMHALSRLVDTFADFLKATYVIIGFLVFWGYGIFYEIRWNGQTPGKRQLGLRVMREGGYPVNVFGVVIRNLLWVVDFLPMLFFAGMVSILTTRDYQRIGDLVGGTLVVKQRPSQSLEGLLRVAHITPEHLNKDALEQIMEQADALTPDEYRAVRHFTERRRQLVFDAQQAAAVKIAVPLMRRLNIVPPPGATMINYADFLEYLAVAYEQLRRPK
jgi:uncharacterized RDD family membrane protein YckC